MLWIAQQVEQLTCNQLVTGSIPVPKVNPVKAQGLAVPPKRSKVRRSKVNGESSKLMGIRDTSGLIREGGEARLDGAISGTRLLFEGLMFPALVNRRGAGEGSCALRRLWMGGVERALLPIQNVRPSHQQLARSTSIRRGMGAPCQEKRSNRGEGAERSPFLRPRFPGIDR